MSTRLFLDMELYNVTMKKKKKKKRIHAGEKTEQSNRLFFFSDLQQNSRTTVDETVALLSMNKFKWYKFMKVYVLCRKVLYHYLSERLLHQIIQIYSSK